MDENETETERTIRYNKHELDVMILILDFIRYAKEEKGSPRCRHLASLTCLSL